MIVQVCCVGTHWIPVIILVLREWSRLELCLPGSEKDDVQEETVIALFLVCLFFVFLHCFNLLRICLDVWYFGVKTFPKVLLGKIVDAEWLTTSPYSWYFISRYTSGSSLEWFGWTLFLGGEVWGRLFSAVPEGDRLWREVGWKAV